MKKHAGLLLVVLVFFSSCGLLEAIIDTVLNLVVVEMVSVEGGTLALGGTDDTVNPSRDVTISSFDMGKYEITIAQYIRFLNGMDIDGDAVYDGTTLVDTSYSSCPIEHNGRKFVFKENAYVDSDNAPMYGVSWYSAVHFCNWLSESNSYTQVYVIDGTDVSADFSVDGYRLPTEMEWEYAARGGQSTLDYIYAGGDNIEDVAWYISNSDNDLHEKGQKESNELGIYDMSGNVIEWCWDWYEPYIYLIDNDVTDPRGPATDTYNYDVTLNGSTSHWEGTYTKRVQRGGHIRDTSRRCETNARLNATATNTYYGNGFRVVRVRAF